MNLFLRTVVFGTVLAIGRMTAQGYDTLENYTAQGIKTGAVPEGNVTILGILPVESQYMSFTNSLTKCAPDGKMLKLDFGIATKTQDGHEFTDTEKAALKEIFQKKVTEPFDAIFRQLAGKGTSHNDIMNSPETGDVLLKGKQKLYNDFVAAAEEALQGPLEFEYLGISLSRYKKGPHPDCPVIVWEPPSHLLPTPDTAHVLS